MKKWISAIGALLVMGMGSWNGLQAQSLVINEIMHHPASTNVLEQWFELHNPGTLPVNLTGWKVSQGVSFDFPTNTLIGPGAFLVVAADLPTFTQLHPGISKVVGGWSGTIGHSLEISDPAGRAVSSVQFGTEGDWAVRVLGAGGAVGLKDSFNGLGWEWIAPHDGSGASLELQNPSLPVSLALNWVSNLNTNSTPGAPNSVFSTNIAPLISEVTHIPVIPQPGDPVTITARVTDESVSAPVVALSWRKDGDATFASVPMFDDGNHGDGLASDGVYGAILAPHAHSTIIEFFITARDAGLLQRRYPDWIAPLDSSRTANLLYQVDKEAYAGAQPVYRLIMTEAERAYLESLSDAGATTDSDAMVNATWITSDAVLDGGTTTQLRYNVGVRNRGHGSRLANPHNFHVNIPDDRTWKDQKGINLNSQYAQSQVLGSAIFRKLGLPMADSRGVQLRINSTNQMDTPGQTGNSFGAYAANQQYNNDFVQSAFPLDSKGNSYRGIRDPQAGVDSVADLSWHGPDIFQPVYTNAYFKQNNTLANDWSDLIRLIGTLNEIPGYSTPATYVGEIQKVLDVDQWMQYFAINVLLDNTETSPVVGIGDDYALYRGTLDTRFLLLPYDADSLMGRGVSVTPSANGIFRMTALPVFERLMKSPEFVPIYFKWLKRYAEGPFASASMNPLIDQLMRGWVPEENIARFKSFNDARVSFVLGQIPLQWTVTSELPTQSGYPRTTTATIALHGDANAIETRSILVNGHPANYTAWQGRWTNSSVTVSPGLNRILIQALGEGGGEVARQFYDVWYDDGSTAAVPSSITSDLTWTAAGGPYNVSSSVTVNAGATLTIQPGTTVYLGSGANLTVANGGRLIALGTSNAPIRFSRAPASTASWGGITINGSAGSPETQMAWVHLEFNGSTAIHSTGGTLTLDHLTFGTTSQQYLSLDASSFIVSHCHFPTPSGTFEPVHGTGGIKAGGRGIFYRNFHGAPNGYNDVIDFTGGNRPGNPIFHVLDSVFVGSGDDILDLDGTDAWVEGNIFLHAHKNGSPDSASAVSGGDDSGNTSQITVLNNLFYDVDQAATAKLGNYYTFLNNTVVHQTKKGGLDSEAAVLGFADEGIAQAAGMYVEGNIFYDVEQLTRYLTNSTPVANATVFTNNLMPFTWAGRGGANSTQNPLLRHIPALAETVFNSWQEAQVMKEWFSLLPGSPAHGSGPNLTDKGGGLPLGAGISGEPIGTNASRTAILTVGSLRSGGGIPSAGWPSGSGYTHYKWRLDKGPWSAETPITIPIQLTGLTDGPHQVEVTGKRDSGLYQDDPQFGELAVVTTSQSWVVDPNITQPNTPTVRIQEVLAANLRTLTNGATTPDFVELYNFGASTVDLSGMGLSDNASAPYKFVFPAGSSLAAGSYLLLFADNPSIAPGVHLGFSLKQGGDEVLLTDSPVRGGAPIDSVEFGLQLPDHSIGRGVDGHWTLCQPTPGSPNNTLPLGAPQSLRINEWLADAQFVADNDFIELYNTSPLPVALGGLYLSDASGSPKRYRIASLSFIGALDFARWIADSDPGQGADHLNFKLSPDFGMIWLTDGGGETLDVITYGPQRTDVSEGRSPNGGTLIASFAQPTPGGGNPGSTGGSDCTVVTESASLLPLDFNWHYNQTADLDGIAWTNITYNDSSWQQGHALLAVESCGCLPSPGIQTPLTIGRSTYYFRTAFVLNTNLSGFSLNVKTIVDDGAVVYLNGREWFRVGMPTGAPDYATRASRNVDNGSFEFFSPSPQALRQGTNVLAVEVHQINTSSSDITFGLSIDATRSSTNCNAIAVLPVVINEILANSRAVPDASGRASDWIELVNVSTNSVNLTGVSLTDDPGFPRKWTFPDGTLLPAKNRRVIFFDGSTPASEDNTGFNLSAVGGGVYLFDKPAAGGALVDAATYGLQIPDYSIGRSPDGDGVWSLNIPSPNAVNVSAALANPSSLRVNEWMADPVSGTDWFELFNTAEQPVALGGLYLTDNLADRFQSPIAPLSFIGVGSSAYLQFMADGSPNKGPDHVNFSLKKAGEAIGIFSPGGIQLDAVGFGPQTTGVSQGRLPDGQGAIVAFPESSTPGSNNYLPLPNALINEVLTHTDPPLEDVIELYNPTSSDVSIGGWYLSNDPNDPKRFQIPSGTILPARGFKVFYEAAFGSGSAPFTLNSAHGDQVVLSQSDPAGNLSGFQARVSFSATANGVSLGRFPTSIGVDFVALQSRTFGQDQPSTLEQFRLGQGKLNASAKVGPITITEIHYLPLNAGVENQDEEFLELENISTVAVPLFDPAYPTNTWRITGGVDFTFPPSITLASGARMLVVGFDPGNAALLATFRSHYNVPAGVTVLGPWSGALGNSGDRINLWMPDPVQLPPHPDAGFVPQILVDRVSYLPSAPWPAGASAGSESLQRIVSSDYGNDPIHWKSANPTPGRANGSVSNPDSDGDGMEDSWELNYFGSLGRDGTEDYDGDGMIDLAEFEAGTSPLDPEDLLRFASVQFQADGCVLEFKAVTGKTYSVLYRDSLGDGAWLKLRDIPASGTTGLIQVLDPSPRSLNRFYQLLTPSVP